jgi:hypothetical protein
VTLLTGYAIPEWIRRPCEADYQPAAAPQRARLRRPRRRCEGTAARAACQDLTVGIIEPPVSILALDERLKFLDNQLEELFAQHPQPEITQSVPGFAPIPRAHHG